MESAGFGQIFRKSQMIRASSSGVGISLVDIPFLSKYYASGIQRSAVMVEF